MGKKESKLVFLDLVQVRVFLEIVYAFIIEKYQDYVTELATFKNYELRSAFYINTNWVSQIFVYNSKYI